MKTTKPVSFKIKTAIKDIDPEIGKQVMGTKIKHKEVQMFCHCKKCLGKFLKSSERSKMSPGEAMSYEVGSVPFTYPDGTTIGIMAVFCKNCKSLVWDSRHLTNMF